MKPRTLLLPTVLSSKHSEVRSPSRVTILISKSLSYAKWADGCSRGCGAKPRAKRQAAAEAAVGSCPRSRFSQRIRVKHSPSLSFSLPQHPLWQSSYSRFPLLVFSFSASSYFHVSTYRVSSTLVRLLSMRGREKDSGRGEALCIGNFKSQSGNNLRMDR